MKEPPRGQSEGVNVRGMSGFRAYYDDVIYCIKIPSYVIITLGTAMGTFSQGGLAQWVSLFLYKTSRDIGHPYTNTETNLIFGAALVIGGIGGIIVSTDVAKRLRSKIGPTADCYVCAFSLYVGSVLVYIALTVASYSLPAAFVSYNIDSILSLTVIKGVHKHCSILLQFLLGSSYYYSFGELLLSWLHLYERHQQNIIIPERRSTATGFQVFASHILGDAASPLLIGMVRSTALCKPVHCYCRCLI